MILHTLMRRFIIIILCVALSLQGLACSDSIPEKKTKRVYSPKTASILSACIPGAGQAYNGRYWKMPVVYVGLAVPAWFVYDLNKEYKRYKNAYIYRTDNDPATTDNEFQFYQDAQVKENVDFYRRYRDMNIFITGFVYALNIIDAGVDAHLRSFDVSNDLSIMLKPAPFINGIQHTRGELSFTLKF